MEGQFGFLAMAIKVVARLERPVAGALGELGYGLIVLGRGSGLPANVGLGFARVVGRALD